MEAPASPAQLNKHLCLGDTSTIGITRKWVEIARLPAALELSGALRRYCCETALVPSVPARTAVWRRGRFISAIRSESSGPDVDRCRQYTAEAELAEARDED